MEDIILVGLDRDRTINYDNDFYVGKEENWKDQLEILPYVVEGIKKLKEDSRIKVIVATNQSGVALEYISTKRAYEVNKEIDKMLRNNGAFVDGWYFCPFVDNEYVKEKNIVLDNEWVKDTELRKPGIGMLKKASKDLGVNLNEIKHIYFIGDRKLDVETGLNANGKGILIIDKDNEKHQEEVRELMKSNGGRIFFANNLLEAANIILEDINL